MAIDQKEKGELKRKTVSGIMLTLLLGVSVWLLSMSVLATEHVSSEQIRTMEIGIQSSSKTVTHCAYAVKDADDRPTGTDVELRIGREWGSTECWLQFDLNSIARYSRVANVTFWFYHTRTTYQENAIRMMGNDDWDWTEDGVDKPDGNWSIHALAWYDYGDAQMPPMWMGWNDTQTAKMGLQYPFTYGPVTGHLTEYVNEILTHENRNFTLVLRNIWGDGAGGSHYHASRESGHVPYLEMRVRVPLVGGISIPVNKLELLAPYIGLVILLAVAVTTVGYVKKRKRHTQIIS